jgi:hypothetical protein
VNGPGALGGRRAPRQDQQVVRWTGVSQA